MATNDDIVRAAQAFQNAVPGDDEYGVTDEDAARGIVAALRALNLVNVADLDEIVRVWNAQDAEAKARTREAEATRHAGLSPQERLIEDKQNAGLRALADDILHEGGLRFPLYDMLTRVPDLADGVAELQAGRFREPGRPNAAVALIRARDRDRNR